MAKNIKCLRCGKCCWYQDFRNRWKPCRFLEFSKNKTYCSIYNHRIGTPIASGNICTIESKWNIPKCPFNKPEKPKHPFWYKQQVLKWK